MNFNINPTELPKDTRWVDLIPKLQCPQCLMYQCSHISHLERHVIFHCKCRPSLFKNHYMKELRHIAQQANEDIFDLIRLTLEAKLLQWKREGMPEIPFLLRYNDMQKKTDNEKPHSILLDLWRLWLQEIDYIGLEFTSSDILQLIAESESLHWEPEAEVSSPTKVDDEIDMELVKVVNKHLSDLQSKLHKRQKEFQSEDEEIDFDAIPKLEREALIAAHHSN